MRARKVDATQAEIVDALRRAGCRVWIVDGALDLVVQRGFGGDSKTWLLEVKRPGGPLTKTQRQMGDEGWLFHVVESVTEAYDAVGVPLRARL